MTIPDDRTLEVVTLGTAGAIHVFRDGDYDGAIDRFVAVLAIIRDAREAAILAGPWAGQAKVSA